MNGKTIAIVILSIVLLGSLLLNSGGDYRYNELHNQYNNVVDVVDAYCELSNTQTIILGTYVDVSTIEQYDCDEVSQGLIEIGNDI